MLFRSVAKALPATYVIPELPNQDPYSQYRFGVAIAGAKGAKKRAEDNVGKFYEKSSFGENEIVVSYGEDMGPIIADASGNLDSTAYIATQYGGTGTSTSPNAGQILYSSSGTTYAPTNLSSVITQQTPTDGQSGNKTYVGTTTPGSPVAGDIWVDNTGEIGRAHV